MGRASTDNRVGLCRAITDSSMVLCKSVVGHCRVDTEKSGGNRCVELCKLLQIEHFQIKCSVLYENMFFLNKSLNQYEYMES